MYVPYNRNSLSYVSNFYNNNSLNYYNYCQSNIYYSFMPLYSISLLVNSLFNNREEAMPSEKNFSPTELAAFDGSKGRPAYISVNGVIYDVSNSPSWAGGTHFGNYAGKSFSGCHNTDAVLSNLPKVGKLEMK